MRLASPDSGRFRWMIGGLYDDNRRTVLETVTIPGSHLLLGGTSDAVSIANTSTDIREEAVYGELSYDLLPDLTATVGARYFSDALKTDQSIAGSLQVPSTAANKARESALTPRFNLSYKITPTNMIYFQAAEGYRVGQVNTAISDPISGQKIPGASGPDRLWNYELGSKNTFLDGRLLVDVSVYHIDWSDIQLDQQTIPSGIYYIANAGEAHINGAEMKLDYKPTRQWSFGGSLSVLESRLDKVNATVTAQKGDTLPGSAPVSVSGYVQLAEPVGGDATVFGRVDAKYGGKEYADLVNSTSLVYGRATDVNLRAGVSWHSYTLTAFVENVANGDARVSAFPAFAVPVAIRQQPRTFGLTLDALF